MYNFSECGCFREKTKSKNVRLSYHVTCVYILQNNHSYVSLGFFYCCVRVIFRSCCAVSVSALRYDFQIFQWYWNHVRSPTGIWQHQNFSREAQSRGKQDCSGSDIEALNHIAKQGEDGDRSYFRRHSVFHMHKLITNSLQTTCSLYSDI